ncbi:MAG: molybdopterin molybdotransferase MoeA [Desulfovibrionaceae bacterium]
MRRLSRAQAVNLLLEHCAPTLACRMQPMDAVGLVAAEKAQAACPIPGHPTSLRDGFALRSADTATASANAPVCLPVTLTLTAESRLPAPLLPGQAVRLLTGGPVPPDADAVLGFEDVREEGETISLHAPVLAGQHIRPEGGDLPLGDIIAFPGRAITPQAAALLTRSKVVELAVHPRPSVCMFGLGNELGQPGTAIKPGCIPADNVVLVRGLLERWGARVLESRTLPDDLEAIGRALLNAPLPDVVITTGGTGRSRRDFAHEAALLAGYDLLFNGLDMRPGKQVFAALKQDGGRTVALIGLPGPPNAVYACLHAVVLPLVRRLRGLTPASASCALLKQAIRTRPGSEWIVPCTLDLHEGRLTAQPLIGEGPTLRALALADAAIALPPDRDLTPELPVELLASPLPGQD